MKKSKNARQPSCPNSLLTRSRARTALDQLVSDNSLPSDSYLSALSTSDSSDIVFNIDTPTNSTPVPSDSETSESIGNVSSRSTTPSLNRSLDTSSDEEGDMARPQLKFLSPPTFKGQPDEDALNWLDRYIKTGQYNRWGHDDLSNNFNMYLDEAARKWYFCSNLPTNWEDLPLRPDPDNQGQNLPPAVGLKTRFLQEFQQENFTVFQEAKLRNRSQGLEEPTTNYYYDILDLCRIVNPHMPEADK